MGRQLSQGGAAGWSTVGRRGRRAGQTRRGSKATDALPSEPWEVWVTSDGCRDAGGTRGELR